MFLTRQNEGESWNLKRKAREEIHGWSERAEMKLVGVKGGSRGQTGDSQEEIINVWKAINC